VKTEHDFRHAMADHMDPANDARARLELQIAKLRAEGAPDWYWAMNRKARLLTHRFDRDLRCVTCGRSKKELYCDELPPPCSTKIDIGLEGSGPMSG
jgi:hypothetical protein